MRLIVAILLILIGISTNLVAQVQSLTRDENGKLLILTENQVFLLEETGKKVPVPVSTQENIQAIAADKNGTLWLATDQGLVRCHNADCKPDARMADVRSIATDETGVPWVGARTGLFKLDKKGLVPVTVHSGMVDALAFDQDGVLWLGAGFEVKRLRNGTAETFALPPPPANVRMRPPITSLLITKSGKVYVGTHQGLLLMSGKTLKKISEDEVQSLAEDAQGNLYIGTSDGLKKMENQKILNVPF